MEVTATLDNLWFNKLKVAKCLPNTRSVFIISLYVWFICCIRQASYVGFKMSISFKE